MRSITTFAFCVLGLAFLAGISAPPLAASEPEKTPGKVPPKVPILEDLAALINPQTDIIDGLQQLAKLRQKAGQDVETFKKEKVEELRALKKGIKYHLESRDSGTRALAKQLDDTVRKNLAWLKAASVEDLREYQRACIEAKQDEVRRKLRNSLQNLDSQRLRLGK